MKTLFTAEDLEFVLKNTKQQSGPGIGLYRDGYRAHGSDFWGLKPGSEVMRYFRTRPHISWEQTSILELGAGTGKNILEFVRHNARRAVAVEVDSLAVTALMSILVHLEEAGLIPEGKLAVVKDDALNFLAHNTEQFDIVVCYGLLHVFSEEAPLKELVNHLTKTVAINGTLILQSLTNKYPAPASQPELSGISVTSERIKGLFEPGSWEVDHWDESDIVHSHVGSEENHRHGSVRATLKRRRS